VPNATGLLVIVAATFGAESGDGVGSRTAALPACPVAVLAGAGTWGSTSLLASAPGPPFWPPTRPKPL